MNAAHAAKLILVHLVAAAVLPARADDAKIRQALEKGIVTGQFLQTLTPDDVPEKWKVQEETKEKDTYFARTFSRGGVKVLSVVWQKGTKPGQEKGFIATLCHGDKRLGSIAHMADSTSIMPPDAPKEYQVFTQIKDDGIVSVTVLNEKANFFESIIIKGRDIHPIDDLDYTKAALAIEGITKPLMEALQEKMDAKPEPTPDKSATPSASPVRISP